MVVILLRDYPTNEGSIANAFVHTRVLAYLRKGINLIVFKLNYNGEATRHYIIDGVPVYTGNKKEFLSRISSESDINICVHFIDSGIIDCLESANNITKVVIFVHGFEALFWYQRIFPYTFRSLKVMYNFLRYIQSNTSQLRVIRRFVKSTKLNCQFVAVSEWMKNQAENAWKCKGKLKWNIIPNYINETQFAFQEKSDIQNRHLLCIRSFGSGKYANDITKKLIDKLEHEYGSNSWNFTWFGWGILYKKLTKGVRKYGNVKLFNQALNHDQIYKLHRENGLFICPTRQDAQGVSMCEAMSSGLIPITLYNTAIPEFLPNVEMLKCHNVTDMFNLISKLFGDVSLFQKLSKECSNYIHEKCSFENTIQREIDLIANNSFLTKNKI